MNAVLQGQIKHSRSGMVAVQGPNEALPYYIHTYTRADNVVRDGYEDAGLLTLHVSVLNYIFETRSLFRNIIVVPSIRLLLESDHCFGV
jgi:hypothetical protein